MALGLKGSRATTKDLHRADRERLVLEELDKDPALRLGVRTVMYKVAHNTGIHVSRYVSKNPVLSVSYH
jgi:predicted ATPase